MKKGKIQKSYFDTFKWTSGESETTFFCSNSYASKDKMVRIWATFLKKLIFYFSPQVPYL
jgi:hypothetical protein